MRRLGSIIMSQMSFDIARRIVAHRLALSTVVLAVGWGGMAAAQSTNLAVSSVSLSGSNFILSGSGALSGATYYVLASTNLALAPVALWNPISTNTFPATGAFTNSISVDLTIPQEFFVIAMPLTYTIGTSSSPTNGGLTSGGGTVAAGSNVTVCATTNSCYSFVNWTDQNSNVLSTAACFSFTAVSNGNLVANFAPVTYTIGTSSSPANGGSTAGGGTVACSSNVTVCAATNACYSFVNWTDQNSNVLSTAACYSFTAVSNRTLVANFAPLSYTIGTSSSPTAGGFTGGGGTVACSSNVTVCATTNASYSFVNWTDQNSNVLSTAACYSFTAVSNRTLVANFTPLSQGSPTAPEDLIASGVSSNQINLSWLSATDSVGVVAYLVERQGPGSTNFVQVATPSGTSYSDTGLMVNTNYSYRVRAKDAAQNLGPYSNVAGATTLPRLVAAYSFDEGTGTTVTDLSGNGNTGTITAGTWTNGGKYGNALVFNGTSAWVTINSSASLNLTTGMTLEAWVNPSLVDGEWEDVIYKGSDDYFLEATSPLDAVPAAGGTFAGADVVAFGGGALASNTWTHLAETYDGTTVLLYVNGVSAGSLAQTGNIQTSANPLQIGGDNIYGQFFQGAIDEVRVYNVALTPTQIQTDMNTPLGSIPSAPGNLSATPIGTNQVTLLWTASTDNLGVTGYLVERQGPGSTNFVQIGTTSATSYNDTGLMANTNYSYRVRAQDGAGHLGPYSNVVRTFTGLSISPRAVVLTLTQTEQFSTSFTSANFIWSVDGVAGGSASAGTITATGLYSPPNSPGMHTVTVANQTQSATATVYVSVYPGTVTYHNDNLRTGQNLNETVLTPTNVNAATFGKLFSYALDGYAYASPLYMANVSIPSNGVHNVVFMVTEHDSVYAFDADGLTNSPLWQVSFINPAAGVTTVPCSDTQECGDIPNEIGITSTPVIDPTNGTLYVVAKTKEVSGNTTTYVQRLHALDITTGAEKFGGPVVIQGSVPGTGLGSAGGQVAFNPLRENQRTGLLLANGVVYFGFASHGDYEPYYGWEMGYNATNVQLQTLLFNDAPNGNKGGIWMNGDGSACDSSGNIYFITGDGTFTVNTGGSDYGDSFLKMSPSGVVTDYFTPSVQTTLDAGNLDLGAGGVLLLPDQSGAHPHEMLSAGKNGTIYLVNRDNMGHYNATNDNIVEEVVNIFTNATSYTGGSFCSPVYFNGNVYFSPVKDNVQAFSLTNGLVSMSPTSRSSEQYGSRGGTMAISANGNSSGILWTLQTTGTASPGVLYAYDATNLTNELYNSNQAGTRDALDVWLKFTVPVVANGKVFISSVSQLTVYGLLP